MLHLNRGVAGLCMFALDISSTLSINVTYIDDHFVLGTSIGCVIRCNFRALQNGDFQTLGQMIATIIIQGGSHPRVFSPSICDYIAYGLDECKPSIEEIHDGTVRNSLKKVIVNHLPLIYEICLQLTIMKKMVDVHFTTMHCGQKLFKKANRHLLKDRHKTGG